MFIQIDERVEHDLNHLAQVCFGNASQVGWWDDLPPEGTKERGWYVATRLCLTHSELSEGMEGHRKGLMDDHLPHRPMLEVELADAVIRIADLAGALKLDLGGAVREKLVYNASRADHKKEAREAEGGKTY